MKSAHSATNAPIKNVALLCQVNVQPGGWGGGGGGDDKQSSFDQLRQ